MQARNHQKNGERMCVCSNYLHTNRKWENPKDNSGQISYLIGLLRYILRKDYKTKCNNQKLPPIFRSSFTIRTGIPRSINRPWIGPIVWAKRNRWPSTDSSAREPSRSGFCRGPEKKARWVIGGQETLPNRKTLQVARFSFCCVPY